LKFLLMCACASLTSAPFFLRPILGTFNYQQFALLMDSTLRHRRAIFALYIDEFIDVMKAL
jgi:hypothetical protein